MKETNIVINNGQPLERFYTELSEAGIRGSNAGKELRKIIEPITSESYIHHSYNKPIMTILEDLQKQKADLVENRTKLLLKESEVKRLLELNKKQTKLIAEAIEKEIEAADGNKENSAPVAEGKQLEEQEG